MTPNKPQFQLFPLLCGLALYGSASAALINLTNDTTFNTVNLSTGASGTTEVPLSYYTTSQNSQARGALVDGALLLQGSSGAGSGVYRRLFQVNASGQQETEDGYNRAVTTNKNGSEFEEGIPTGFDPFLRIKDLSATNGYYFFSLDSNENNNATDKWVSITEIQFYVGGPTDPAILPSTFDGLSTLGTKVWDLQANPIAGSRNDVMLNDTLQSGSGTDNMYLLLPSSLLSGFDPESYLYLYVSHGHLGTNESSHGAKFVGFGESGGFEEWSTFTQTSSNPPASFITPIPELSTSLMALSGTLILALRRRRE
jgi:hypothetical protein